MAPTTPTTAPPISITYDFDDRESMKYLLNKVGISSTCITRLMQIEDFEIARDLALTSAVDIKATV